MDNGLITYNILLELGDWDLSEYFAIHQPPALIDKRVSFWWDLFRVVDTVRDIHEFKIVTVHGSETHYGCHADIKPNNILRVDGEFKLADFGEFEDYLETPVENTGRIHRLQPVTFCAPERWRPDYQLASGHSLSSARSIDIWSLGCVLSVTATWMVFGKTGIEWFDKIRRQAISRIVRNRLPSEASTSLLGRGDYFHDGRDVLRVVCDWHKYLRRGLRPDDKVTPMVLDLVDHDMLIGNPDDRISAHELSNKLQEIKRRYDHDPPSPVDDTIREVLFQVDKAWVARDQESHPSPS